MSLDDWDGFERFLNGDESTEWVHFTMQDTPDYMWEHTQNRYESQYDLDQNQESEYCLTGNEV